MQVAVFTWPGRKRVVFRSISRRRVLDALKTLAGIEISSRHSTVG